MPRYELAEPGIDMIANPPKRGRGRLPWLWVGLLALIVGCIVAGVVGLVRRPAAVQAGAAAAGPTATRTYIVEVSSLSATPGPTATATGTLISASTQTPWVVTREVARNVEVIRITIQVVDRQVVVPQDRAVIVTVKVPWVITQIAVITTTPMPTYTPYPTYTEAPTQTPWVVTATPTYTPTPTGTPYFEPVTETPTVTMTPTVGADVVTETATVTVTP